MKKRKDWLTKAKKRKVKKKDRGIVDLMRILYHFFGELPQWLNEMSDPRNPSYTTYTQSDLVFMGVIKNMCGIKTMHSMEEQFNEESKNDCEINAAKRLLERLKRDYPKLPVCLQGDALYAAESIMKIENEGFNNQKNGIYDIEHLNSRNSNAMKMYSTFSDTRQCILNNEIIIAQGGGRME